MDFFVECRHVGGDWGGGWFVAEDFCAVFEDLVLEVQLVEDRVAYLDSSLAEADVEDFGHWVLGFGILNLFEIRGEGEVIEFSRV